MVLLATTALVLSCTGKDPYNPGTPLGTFKVSAKVTSNGCLTTPDPWVFTIRLSRDGQTLYWDQGGAPVSGALDAQLHVTMTDSSTQLVHGADAGTGACEMSRTDALDATLGADPVTSFTGKLSYAFAQTPGSDCSDQMASAGGTFNALPCEVHYDLTGTRTIAPRSP